MLFLVDGSTKTLHTVDPATAQIHLLGPVPGIYSPKGLTTDGTALYLMEAMPGTAAGVPAWVVPRSLWSISLSTGATSLAFQAPASATGAFEDVDWYPPTGTFMMFSHLFTLLQNVWSATPGGSLTSVCNGFATLPFSYAVDGAGMIWALKSCAGTAGCGSQLGTVSLANWQFTPLLNTTYSPFSPITFHPQTGALWVADQNSRALFVIDTASLATAQIGTLAGPPGSGAPVAFPSGLAWAPVSGPMATTQVVGTGCPGANGVPVLTPAGSPTLGNLGFGIQLTGAAALSTSWWFIADSVTPTPTAFAVPGCPVWLDLTSVLAYVSLGMNPIATITTDALGTVLVPIPVFNNPFWAGIPVAFQVAISDSLAPNGLTVSNALLIAPGF